ncbi:hypothetical protein J7T55_014762 [Diaporthe amygdali]|uniref:uncharacterized protein n=1 Tax=Phomopsis amygdali TaxID=1214568 RepID=UPI0022FDD88C|nr:uncharacterized protein J7T55_014762 [Diaporthe amygdali]KAJ0109960.1 hypothetical protein J7T55_014762 [Diaporthe amygdali]
MDVQQPRDMATTTTRSAYGGIQQANLTTSFAFVSRLGLNIRHLGLASIQYCEPTSSLMSKPYDASLQQCKTQTRHPYHSRQAGALLPPVYCSYAVSGFKAVVNLVPPDLLRLLGDCLTLNASLPRALTIAPETAPETAPELRTPARSSAELY